jgi:hypothetical protein
MAADHFFSKKLKPVQIK